MRCAKHLGLGCHAGDPNTADEAAKVEKIWLNDLHGIVFNHPTESMQARFLFAAGNGNFQGVGHLLGFFQLVETARFFIKSDLMVLQNLADANCF